MIDTDQYEGHTPAPWDGILSGYFTIEQLKEIDKTLMQDAPLLLEEVKRLRGEPEVNCCPTCGSSDITIYDSFVDSGSHKVSCEADGCESRWFEIWRHVGIEMIEGDDNR